MSAKKMKGWITYNLEDKELLTNLGVELVGEPKVHNPFTVTQDCSVPNEVFDEKFDGLWGQCYWGLTYGEE
jgi:hypothetical protein